LIRYWPAVRTYAILILISNSFPFVPA